VVAKAFSTCRGRESQMDEMGMQIQQILEALPLYKDSSLPVRKIRFPDLDVDPCLLCAPRIVITTINSTVDYFTPNIKYTRNISSLYLVSNSCHVCILHSNFEVKGGQFHHSLRMHGILQILCSSMFNIWFLLVPMSYTNFNHRR
jgi:hypothetical protein